MIHYCLVGSLSEIAVSRGSATRETRPHGSWTAAAGLSMAQTGSSRGVQWLLPSVSMSTCFVEGDDEPERRRSIIVYIQISMNPTTGDCIILNGRLLLKLIPCLFAPPPWGDQSLKTHSCIWFLQDHQHGCSVITQFYHYIGRGWDDWAKGLAPYLLPDKISYPHYFLPGLLGI